MGGLFSEGEYLQKRRRRLVMLLSTSAGILVVGMIMAVAMMLTKPDRQAYPTGSALSIPAAGEAGEGPMQTPTPLATPGLVIYGRVQQLNGSGVAGVEIFRRYAGYPGEVVATTNAEGYYLSDFYPIPGDEMVTVWAEAPELRFAPEYYYWRHYYGYEITGHDFTVRRP
jgi:hypothetical protein